MTIQWLCGVRMPSEIAKSGHGLARGGSAPVPKVGVSMRTAAYLQCPTPRKGEVTTLAGRRGRARAIAQHGEIFQGIMRDRVGSLHRCLLSLPCPVLRSDATFTSGADEIRVRPEHKVKALRAAQLTLSCLGVSQCGGLISVLSTIPEGKGYGSSTADCVAAVRATARAFDIKLPTATVAELAVQAEVASDGIMFNRSVLFAQREGRVLHYYSRPLPPLLVIGFDTAAPNDIVDTLAFPPAAYSRTEIEKFQMLLAGLDRAMQTQDLTLLGRVATASAEINDRFLPKQCLPEIRHLVSACGALGVAVAHSGTVVSVLINAADPDSTIKADRIQGYLEKCALYNVMRFYSRDCE
jgi:uncharacterized protein involved in propanediol utilization